MLRSYFKVSIRNLLRNRVYSVINITGLAMGIAFCLLIYLYVQHERAFDCFHANVDRLYRLEATNLFNRAEEPPQSGFLATLLHEEDKNNQLEQPMTLAGDLKANFPEIKQVLRFKNHWGETIRYRNQGYKEDRVLFTDANFFQLFSFPLLQGNPGSALEARNNLVISENAARRYFGNEDPIGKTLEIVWEKPALFTITGVAKDAPVQSSLQFDFVIPITALPYYQEDLAKGTNSSSVLTVIELAEGVSPESFNVRLNHFGKKYFKSLLKDINSSEADFNLTTRRFADGHYNISAPWGHYTSLRNIYQLVCLTAVILLIACLNYVLLTLTHTAARSQEVGLRKVIGARRRQIIGQFWIETQLIVGMAVIAGWGLAMVMLPYFNILIEGNIDVSLLRTDSILLALTVAAILVGGLSGLYPALFISGFKPLSIVKKHQTFRIKPALSRTLVVFQYAACITLLIASFVISRQMQFVNEKDLGFDKEQILAVKNQHWGNPQKTALIRERLQAFAATEPGISFFASTGHTFGQGYNTNHYQIGDKKQGVTVLRVDYDYFTMLGLNITQGRNFSPAIQSDTSRKKGEKAVVVNQTLFKMLGPEAKIGEFNSSIERKIIGVVKDYHFNSLTMPLGPAMHELDPKWASYYWFKLRPGSGQATIPKINRAWNTITDRDPFSYSFLNQEVAKLYDSQQRWLKIIRAATVFAILIACLGLFGLSGLNALNRTKEVGIRKIMGASVRQVWLLLNWETIRLTLIACTIAVPVAWYFMQQWLQAFAYRIALSWELFVLAGGLGLLTALIAVSYHSIKAALANPVKSLRSE